MHADSCLGITDEPCYKVNAVRRVIRILVVRMKLAYVSSDPSDFLCVGHRYIAVIYVQVPVGKIAAAYDRHLGRLRNFEVGAVYVILDIFVRIDVSGLYRHRTVRIDGSAVLCGVIRIYRLILFISHHIEVGIVRNDIHPLVIQRFYLHLKRRFDGIGFITVLIDLGLDLCAPEHIVFIFVERFDLQIKGSGRVNVICALVIGIADPPYLHDRFLFRIERTDIFKVGRCRHE